MGEFSEELLRALAFVHRRNKKLCDLIKRAYKELMNVRLEVQRMQVKF